ncbi:Eukaryotic initiation factor 4E family protein [Histomonas meleagridis]|uniref:Eukaryotic initiation factor 4E family protein n=1 Tax=Histomonas meleagridis TaxID=135588 RepID=UPI0035597B4C|nr:Eukaryotic initiation factor 4E family protein [Histomonas meleagridis]KAH0799600.1 Eukaryotic initiation factor 4E family protein [Histomonas meleagridis]
MAHKLSDEWSFYGFTMPSSDETNETEESYSNHIKLLARFSTVEEFWASYSHIIRPSSLPNHGALHLFRGTSRAMREDPEHINGGSFLFRVSKGMASYYWEQLILALIGGRLDDDVIGILISARPKFYNISIWQKNAGDEALRLEICKKFCECIHLPLKTRIDYTKHNTVINTEDNSKRLVHYILEEEGPVCKELPTRAQPHPEDDKKDVKSEETNVTPKE